MISIEILQPSKDDPYKVIFFYDSNEKLLRQNFYNKENILLLDMMFEFNNKCEEVSCMIFSGVDYSTISYREYLYDGQGSEIGTIDYKNLNGELKKINHSENLYYETDKVRKVKWFNDKNEYCFYEIYILSGFVELDGVYIRDDSIYGVNDEVLDQIPSNIEFFNNMDKILQEQEQKLESLGKSSEG